MLSKVTTRTLPEVLWKERYFSLLLFSYPTSFPRWQLKWLMSLGGVDWRRLSVRVWPSGAERLQPHQRDRRDVISLHGLRQRISHPLAAQRTRRDSYWDQQWYHLLSSSWVSQPAHLLNHFRPMCCRSCRSKYATILSFWRHCEHRFSDGKQRETYDFCSVF